jgi:type II secretory pathway pseudopilin PulG
MNARQRRGQAGFTLIEALISTAIATMAGSALLLGISSSIQTTDAVLEQILAEGMAQQLMDEIAGCRYVEAGTGPRPTTLGTESGEASGASRALFDDLDDFHGLNVAAPRDLWGVALGKDNGLGGQRHGNFRAPKNYFSGWRQRVEVYYVDEANLATPLPAGQTSDYRLVRVRILIDLPQKSPRQISELKRVFAYVPNS